MKYSLVILLALSVAYVAAVPRSSQRIVGGSLTTISQYPYAASLLYSYNLNTYYQSCGGAILTTRSVLTAAHCVYGDSTSRWRVRLGSSYANSGGSVYSLSSIVVNSLYNSRTNDYDVAIIKTSSNIIYGNFVKAGSIAGANYYLSDNTAVFAIGWGTVSSGGAASEQLRHVQIWAINQATCRGRYATRGISITDNMLCSGWLDVGGRDQCQGDSGGPLIHNGVIVGICSFGIGCADSYFPGVNARVSKLSTWIQANA